jgi:mannose-1-phosphate guanylyltransferase
MVDANLGKLQATLARLHGLEVAPPRLICSEQHRFFAA